MPPLRVFTRPLPLMSPTSLHPRDGFAGCWWNVASISRPVRAHSNLRELRKTIERAAILSSGPCIEVADLPETISRTGPTRAPEVGGAVTIAELTDEHIRRALAQTARLEEVADTLGIDVATLYRRWAQMADRNIRGRKERSNAARLAFCDCQFPFRRKMFSTVGIVCSSDGELKNGNRADCIFAQAPPCRSQGGEESRWSKSRVGKTVNLFSCNVL